jgi:hypothetical protein
VGHPFHYQLRAALSHQNRVCVRERVSEWVLGFLQKVLSRFTEGGARRRRKSHPGSERSGGAAAGVSLLILRHFRTGMTLGGGKGEG